MTKAAGHDAYLAELGGEFAPQLQDFRLRLAALLPQAEEVISYAMPGFRIGKHVIAGYAGWVKHASFYPHSGGIVPQFLDVIQALGLGHTKSAVHFTTTKPIPDDLLARMIAARLTEAGL